MATFIEIRTDAFAQNVSRVKHGGINYEGVRRPYRGIEIKEDTYGVIKVMKANGDEIPLVDAGGPYGADPSDSNGSGDPYRSGYAKTYNYSNFIIQQVQDARQEKQQVLETFGDSYIFFFGERPRVLSVTGLLMNTLDFNWRTEFWHNYENTLRGTKLVEQNARIYLHWDDIVVEGYMMEAMARDDASSPYHIPFSFQLFVTNHTYLSTVGDDDYPITARTNLHSLLRQDDGDAARKDLKASTRTGQDVAGDVDTVQRVYQSTEDARSSAQVQGLAGLLEPQGPKLLQGKNLMASALAAGLHAQSLTFLSVINRFFKARKMRLPRGIAGMFSYIGPPQYAGMKTEWEEGPKRVMPIRSKIRDNVDEYIGTADNGDQSTRDWLPEQNTSQTEYDMEKRVLNDLKEAGIDPVQHPGGSLLQNNHALGGFAGAVGEDELLAIGFAVSGALANAGQSGIIP